MWGFCFVDFLPKVATNQNISAKPMGTNHWTKTITNASKKPWSILQGERMMKTVLGQREPRFTNACNLLTNMRNTVYHIICVWNYIQNFSIPTRLTSYNPWDREFWTPATYMDLSCIYVSYCSHLNVERSYTANKHQWAFDERFWGNLQVWGFPASCWSAHQNENSTPNKAWNYHLR